MENIRRGEKMEFDCKVCNGRTNQEVRIHTVYVPICYKCVDEIVFRSTGQGKGGPGKCPVDGRENRPIYIIINNARTLAVADGKGHAYKVYGDGYDAYSSECQPGNKYDPASYEFERGLSGMDF